jgi:hypothetical protein
MQTVAYELHVGGVFLIFSEAYPRVAQSMPTIWFGLLISLASAAMRGIKKLANIAASFFIELPHFQTAADGPGVRPRGSPRPPTIPAIEPVRIGKEPLLTQ